MSASTGSGWEADAAVAVVDGAGGQGLHAPRADDELEGGELADGRGRPGETGEVELYLGDDGPPRVDEGGSRPYFFVGLLCGADQRIVTPGWAMQPQGYVVEKGHRLGVVLISTDHHYTLRHPPGTRMTVRTGPSSVTLPVAPPAGS